MEPPATSSFRAPAAPTSMRRCRCGDDWVTTRLVQPIGPDGREEVTLLIKHDGWLRRTALATAHRVRLRGDHLFDQE